MSQLRSWVVNDLPHRQHPLGVGASISVQSGWAKSTGMKKGSIGFGPSHSVVLLEGGYGQRVQCNSRFKEHCPVSVRLQFHTDLRGLTG